MTAARPRGIAMAVVLLTLSMAAVIVVAIGTLGVQHLNAANAAFHTRSSLYAAEAGVAAAMAELSANNRWTAGFGDTSFNRVDDVRYSVRVTNNLRGTTALTAPDGTPVPIGRAYVVSTGTCLGGRYSRRVAVMLRMPPDFEYAIASGGEIDFQANTVIAGSVKASGDVANSSVLTINPVSGKGRLLAGGSLSNSSLTVDPSQDVRARGHISNVGAIGPTTLIEQSDTTDDTSPFLADGRTYNSSASGEEVLPNPDVSRLLAAGSYTDHAGTTTVSGTFDLDDGIHYFPDGVTFRASSNIRGSGTIVVGNGNSAIFEGSVGTAGSPATFNVVALDGDDGQTGGSLIRFEAATFLRGLVYSHGSIESRAAFRLEGSAIAYGDGEFSHTGASARITRAPIPTSLPGFESWFDTGLDRPVVQVSWQRL